MRRLLLLLLFLLVGCKAHKVADPVLTKGVTVGDGDVMQPVIRFGTPRPHGQGTKAWDVPVLVSGLPTVEMDRAAANLSVRVHGGEVTSGWCRDLTRAYTCFGLPTPPDTNRVSMSWLGGWWPFRLNDGVLCTLVVNPTSGGLAVTLATANDQPRFYWRVPGATLYEELPLAISGTRTVALGTP